MREAIDMADKAALYRLMSWLSPSYPVGAFAYSHGLEYAVEDGRVTAVHELIEWIETVLLHGTGRIDGVLFREAYSAAQGEDRAALENIAELGAAFQPSAEIALESLSQGEAFLGATIRAWPGAALTRLEGRAVVYAVAVGTACAAHRIPLCDGLGAYFHGFAANLVSAGVRLVPLGQSDGQSAIAALEPAVAEAEARAMSIALDDLGTAAPLLDLCSMHHETQYSRLFRS
jgi:urease accessory protein